MGQLAGFAAQRPRQSLPAIRRCIAPASIAEEVVQAAFEQEEREAFIHAKIRAGSSILGVYPPDDATLREYAQWKAQRGT